MATMAAEMWNDDSFYASAPTSIRSLSLEDACFYSVPTSPVGTSFKNSYVIPVTEPTTPRDQSYEDADTSFIEFEFETSQRFHLEDDDEDHDSDGRKFESPCKQQQQHYQRKGSLPAMAFADELFCDGKVMPLKPPPRFQYNNESSSSSSTSALSSPKSPVMKFPFLRRSLWNDDFDPFMAALENVKEENRDKIHRRSRSMSPLRAISLSNPDKQREIEESDQKQNQNGLSLNLIEANANSFADFSILVPNKNGRKGCQEIAGKSPIRLDEPKGVLFARHARLVKMSHEKPSKPSKKKKSKGEAGKESEETCSRGSKRKKMKKFLLGSSSAGKKTKEEKAKEENEGLPKQSFTRKFSFRSAGLAQYNEEKKVSEVANITTLMQYRPKLFLCMGYGAKYVK